MKFFPVLKSPALQIVFRSGKHFRFNPFLIFYLKSPANDPKTCCAIVISRSIKAQAALRNRIKRQIRPLIREVFNPHLRLQIVFMVLDDYFNFKTHQLKILLRQIFVRLAKITNNLRVKNE